MKKNIAFVKYAGASAGGTEKFLQTIAANLNKSKFEVDYYYSGPAKVIGSKYLHMPVNDHRLNYLKDNKVNTIEFNVEKIVFSNSNQKKWENTNFYKIFDEEKYDLIQIARSNKNEEPYTTIKNTPIVDSIHTYWGVDDQVNVAKVLIQSDDLKDKWIQNGGKEEKVVTNCTPIDDKKENFRNLKEEFKLYNKFVFGLHQRKDDSIYSSVPLDCYKRIESSKTFFLIMGGSSKYSEQAKELKLKNFAQIDFDFDKDSEEIFLNTLDAYAHGRKDGETFGLAIAEAMRNSLPIISHKNVYNNGHIQTIGNGGRVVGSHLEYIIEMYKLMKIKRYYNKKKELSRELFLRNYESKNKIKFIEQLYLDIIKQNKC